MFAWHEEENLRLYVKRIVGASMIWLVVGIITGLVMAIQRPVPWLFEQWSWWTSARLQLYHGSLLLFGFAIPALYACWILRLRQLHSRPLRWLTFFEWGHMLWQLALVWGTVAIFFGEHSSLPTWVFTPIVYGLLMVASCSIALGFLFNMPRESIREQPLALQLMLLGSWSVPAILIFFLASTHLQQAISPSLLMVMIFFGVFFPLLGLLMPLSLSLPNALDYRRLRLFVWGGLLCFPLASSTFSAAMPGSIFIGLFQLGALVAMIALLYTFVSWWKYPALYAEHWLMPAHLVKPAAPAMPAATFKEGDDLGTDAIWLSFFRWGAICFAIAAAEGSLFAGLRVFGVQPSPTWTLSHHHMLLAGAATLWLQGVFCMLFTAPPETHKRLRRQRIATIAGVLLFSLGNWWEGLLHFYLEQNGIPRGTIHSASGQWLRLLGGASMFMGLWWLTQSIGWVSRNINQLRRHEVDEA